MEKVIYLVRHKDNATGDEFRKQALSTISEQLLAMNQVRKLTISVEDSDVVRAAQLKQESEMPLYQAMLAVWVDSANEQEQILSVLQPYTSRIEAYLVTESEVLKPASVEGERTVGTAQVVAFKQASNLSREEFLSVWRDSHGPLACDIQSSFGYRQNLVVRKLSPEAQEYSAIVEEHFPEAAMDSPHAFFDAVGDDEKLAKHIEMMRESSTRFIDFATISVVHMSEYTVRS